MHIRLALILALLPSTALAQVTDEDAAHKSDREATEALNRSVARSVDQRNAANAATLARYRDAREAYRREREAWRRRVLACQAGDLRACGPD
jgi:hypothetical protein